MKFEDLDLFMRLATEIERRSDRVLTSAVMATKLGCSDRRLRNVLKRLETEGGFGVLLEKPNKKSRRMVLTQNGREFFNDCKQLMNGLERRRQGRGVLPEQLDVASHATLERGILTPAIDRLFQQQPKLCVGHKRVVCRRVTNSHEALDLLYRSRAHIVLAYLNEVSYMSSLKDMAVTMVSGWHFEHVVVLPENSSPLMNDKQRDQLGDLLDRPKSDPITLQSIKGFGVVLANRVGIADSSSAWVSAAGARLVVGSNTRVLEHVARGWVGVTLGWNRIVGEPGKRRFQVRRLKTDGLDLANSRLSEVRVVRAARQPLSSMGRDLLEHVDARIAAIGADEIWRPDDE